MNVGHHLDLLATVVAARPVTIHEDPGSTRAWSDGATIFVPGTGDTRTAAIAQAALLAIGTIDDAAAKALVRRPRLHDRYLALEARRAAAYLLDSWPQIGLLPDLGPLPDPVTDSPGASLELARRSRRLPAAPIAWGRLRPTKLIPTNRPVASTGAPTPADDLRHLEHDVARHTVAAEGAALPKIMNTRRSTVSFRRSRKWSLEAAPGTTATLTADFATDHATDHDVAAWVPPRSIGDDSPPPPPSDGRTFPEWDARRGQYRESHCQVRVVTPPSGLSDMRSSTRDEDGLRRALLPVGLGLTRRSRSPFGDALDLDAAVVALTDLAAGNEPSPKLRIARVRRRRDLTVTVLLDVSASAGDPSGDGRTVHQHQREAAESLVSALESLGARTSLHGFRSNGRSDIEILRVKDFDDPFGREERGRLSSLVPSGHTRLGAAIRYSTRELERDGSGSHRLLVVLSDGFAYDIGYEGAHAKADSHHALLEARRSGVGCLCLTIAASDDDTALREVFGASAHARANCLGDLEPELRRLFTHAVGLAEQARRTHRQELVRA